MKSTNLKAYFLNTLLTVALCAAYCLLGGIFGMVIGLLIAALLGIVFYRDHYLFGITNTVLVFVIFTLFQGPLQALGLGALLLLLALTLALGTRFKVSSYTVLLWCTVLHVLDVLIGLKILGHITGETVTLSSIMLSSGEQMREMMLSQFSDPAYGVIIEQTVSSVVDMSIMLAPAMFIIFSAILSCLLFSVYRKLLNVYRAEASCFLPFEKMQAGKSMAIFYLILLLLLTGTNKTSMFFAATCNVVVVITFVFFVLGLSVFNHKLKEKGAKDVTRKIMIAALICFSTVFFMLPLIAVTLCGLTDAFFDYRQLRQSENKSDDMF